MEQLVIQVPALGLPSLLGLKGFGAPAILEGVVRPSLDILQLYLIQNRESITTGTVAAPAAGGNSFQSNAQVPVGELWYVWHFTVISIAGAGAATRFRAAINLAGQANQPVSLDSTIAATTQGRAMAVCPFWLNGGESLSCIIEQITLTPSYQGTAIITRIRT